MKFKQPENSRCPSITTTTTFLITPMVCTVRTRRPLTDYNFFFFFSKSEGFASCAVKLCRYVDVSSLGSLHPAPPRPYLGEIRVYLLVKGMISLFTLAYLSKGNLKREPDIRRQRGQLLVLICKAANPFLCRYCVFGATEENVLSLSLHFYFICFLLKLVFHNFTFFENHIHVTTQDVAQEIHTVFKNDGFALHCVHTLKLERDPF